MKANDAILKNMQTNMTSLTNSNLELKNMLGQFMRMNAASSSRSRTLPGNTVTNPKEDLKGITTRSETAYQGPTIPTTSYSFPKVVERKTEVTKDTVPPTNKRSTKDVQPTVVQVETPVPNYEPVIAPVSEPVSALKPNQKPSILTVYQRPTIPTTFSSLPLVVERETEATKDTVHPTNNGSTEDVQPLVVPTKFPILNSKLLIAPIIEPVASPVSASKPNQIPLIPYPSRLHDKKLRDKANDQREKLFQIFKDLNFNISFADALILMPKFGPSIKSLLINNNKLFELARTLLNEHYSTVLLKKLPEKLGDPDKFLIPCDFPGMAECLALADLNASINLMPLSVWNKLSLPELTLTLMTLELADWSISRPIGVAEDVYAKVGKFYFPADFVVVDFDADPRVPLILRRSFLNTGRALIDVFKANYNDMTANRIDVINMACEEYSQEVLGFSDVIASGNPTPYYDLIVSTTYLTLTLFENNDFLFEEVDAFLALEDDPTSLEVDQSYVDTEGDILLLEAFLNDDLSLPSLNQGNYLP
nr:reverse transcriptase domain-containing protein [Tanacetum cinerariifolium]